MGCPTCGGLFANRVKFMDHCLKQQEGHSYACVTCEKKFAIERHLRHGEIFHQNILFHYFDNLFKIWLKMLSLEEYFPLT